jgi:hypothetical protein
MLVDDTGRGVLAGPAATADREGALHVKQGSRTAVYRGANLTVGDGMTDTNVHPTQPPAIAEP